MALFPITRELFAFVYSRALFGCIPNFGQAVIRMFKSLPIDKEESLLLFPRKWVKSTQIGQAQNILTEFILKMKSGSNIFHFKCNEVIFVRHMCVSKLNIIGSDNGLSQSHYLSQCWNVVNWTLSIKLQWNFNRNPYIVIKMRLEMPSL